MTGRNWLLWGILATVFGTSGCITSGYDGARLAREAGPQCDIPLTQRNQVYVFVLGGNNPLEAATLDKFRQGLNAQGYAKVATGPSIYYFWMVSEMRRIHSEEPNAVFVVAGLDSSASLAVKLSEKVSDEGIPVLGVVIADPTGKTAGPRGGLRTFFASSERVDNGSAEPRLAEVGEFLNEIAIQSPMPFNNDVVSDWVYPFAADTLTSIEPRYGSEWDFMFDRVGGATRGIADPLPPRVVPATPGNTTTSRE